MKWNEILHTAIATFGFLILLFVTPFYVREAGRIHSWRHHGLVESQWRLTGGANPAYVFRSIAPEDFTSSPIPTAGDTLVSFNGKSMAKISRGYNSSMDVTGSYPANMPVPIEFLQNGDTLQTSLTMRTPSVWLVANMFLTQLFRFVATLAAVIIGFLALRRPATGGARVFALFAFVTVAWVTEYKVFFPDWQSSGFAIPFSYYITVSLRLISAFWQALWLHLLLLYPQPLPIVRKHRITTWIVCYLPAVIQVGNLGEGDLFHLPAIRWLEQLVPGFGLAATLHIIPVLLAFAVLIYRVRTAAQWLEGRQVRIVLWAATCALMVASSQYLLQAFAEMWYYARFSRDLTIEAAEFFTILLMLLAVYHGFRKYRLLDIEGRIRRGTRFAITTGALVIILILLTYGFGRFVLQNAGIEGSVPRLAFGFVLALAVLPTQKRLNRFIEHHFYPERDELRTLLRDFLQQSSTFADENLFWKALDLRLQNGLNVHFVDRLSAICDQQTMSAQSPLLAYLRETQRPLPVDEAMESKKVPICDAEREWLVDHGAGLLAPLVIRNELTAVLVIGHRKDGEDYDPETLQILQSLAPQIAVAHENLKLLQENLDKKRLEQELDMARKTQEGLLPRVLPPTPGLDTAAICRFCNEVAGDYYDVIPLSGDCTALAIADVSGKGVAAALLMASLQSALRTALQLQQSLPEVTASINALVCQNSQPEQFITCFLAIFDPHSSVLRYVNAGHNPPMLVRSEGKMEFLEVGGPFFGIESKWKYEGGEIKLSSGDTLILYTDGVTEAMDRQERLFSDERLQQIVKVNYKNAPAEILQAIENDVAEYHGSPVFEDDFTLLIARCLPK